MERLVKIVSGFKPLTFPVNLKQRSAGINRKGIFITFFEALQRRMKKNWACIFCYYRTEMEVVIEATDRS